MKLFHGTNAAAWEQIQVQGLRGRIPESEGGWGLVYLTPLIEEARCYGSIVLEVETDDLRLTAFDGCEEWEVLCWGAIPADQIRLVELLGR